jgi:hypothetical protein
MPRKKNEIPSQRIRLDGYQPMPILEERDRVAFNWYMANRAHRQAFPIAWELIKAALNGELGSKVKEAVEQGNTQNTIEALQAVQDLIGMFGGEEVDEDI